MDILKMLDIIYHYRIQMEQWWDTTAKHRQRQSPKLLTFPTLLIIYNKSYFIRFGKNKIEEFISVYKSLKSLKLSLAVMSLNISLDRLKKTLIKLNIQKNSVVSELERRSMSCNRATSDGIPTEWWSIAHPQSGTLLTSESYETVGIRGYVISCM